MSETEVSETTTTRPGNGLWAWWLTALKATGIDFFPLRHTLRRYRLGDARADVRAAFNVALLDFPLGMAYALIAGLPVQVGIYGAALASITGPLFASSRFVMLGPSNATAVLLMSVFLGLNLPPGTSPMEVLPLLLVLVAVFIMTAGLLRAASLIQYVSRAVVTGYVTVAALLIIVNQLKYVLAIKVPPANSLVEVSVATFSRLDEAHGASLLVGVLTLSIFLPARRYLKALPNVALTLIAMALLMPLLRGCGLGEVAMLESIQPGAWALRVPRLDFDLLSQLAQPAFALAFLAILESSSIAKSLAARAGDRLDVNQQMFSLGIANMVNAFGSGMVASGSLTRSMVNFTSGARTPVASVFSGCLLVLGLWSVGQFIGYIPRPALAALVIAVGSSLISREQIRIMLRTTPGDAATFGATFVSGLLFPLDMAIYFGALVSIVLFLRKVSRPELDEMVFNEQGELSPLERENSRMPEISIVHVEGDLFFGSAEIFLDQMRLLVQDDKHKIIILRLRNARHLDATSALVIGDLIRLARSLGSHVLVSGVHPEIERVLRQSGMMALLGEAHCFRHVPENPNLSTRDALKRAQELLGDEKANITLFAKPKETG